MIPVQVVGLGMSPQDLTPRALGIMSEAQVLAGGRRLLDYFPDHPAPRVVLGKDPAGALRELAALAMDRRVVILSSGDPNFYGIGPLAVRLLGPDNVMLHPNLTAVQAAAARLKVGWHEARVISLHGRGWDALDAAVTTPGLLFIYTDQVNTPDAVARRLLTSGRTGLSLCVLEDLGQANERVAWLDLEDAAGRTFSPLNMVVLDQPVTAPASGGQPPHVSPTGFHLGMPEEAYTPERGLITKTEVRAAILASLRLHPGQVLWDIGAGSGSVGLEASLLLAGGRIVAVEKNPERAAQISANREKFGVANLDVVDGEAPSCLAALPAPHRVFIGGGGDRVGDILREVLNRLLPGGRVVISATLLDTLEEARGVLSQANWLADVVQIQVSRGQPLSGGSYLKALNPVWIITGSLGEGG